MSTEVVTPEEYVGDVISDFNREEAGGRYGIRKQVSRVVKQGTLAEKFG